MPTADPTTAAILNAYEQAAAAWDAAAAIPSSAYPGLAQWFANPQYTQVVTELNELQVSEIVLKGSYQPHPVVTAVDGTTATVQDCGWDTTYFVYKPTGATPSPQPFGDTLAPGWDSITATMKETTSGTWQLSSQQEKVVNSC
jgi:hypothetical protein